MDPEKDLEEIRNRLDRMEAKLDWLARKLEHRLKYIESEAGTPLEYLAAAPELEDEPHLPGKG
jgi:hypothetical protein